jgi:hypothetical protein
MGTSQLKGRSADVHAGVVENEVIEVDERALEPQTGMGVGEVAPGGPAGADRAPGKALVEPGGRILGGGERAGDGRPVAPGLWLRPESRSRQHDRPGDAWVIEVHPRPTRPPPISARSGKPVRGE